MMKKGCHDTCLASLSASSFPSIFECAMTLPMVKL